MIVLAGIGLVGFWVVLLAYLARDTWLRTLADRRGGLADDDRKQIRIALAAADNAIDRVADARADLTKLIEALRADHHDRLHKLERERQAGPRRA